MNYLATLLLLLSPALYAKPLQICYEDNEYSPALPKYSVDGIATYGIHSQLAVKAFSLAQLEVEVFRLPWKRCLHETSIGNMDAAIGVGWTAERQQQLAFPLNTQHQPDASLCLLQTDYHIYTHQQSELKWDGEKLHQLKFGLSAPQGFVVEQKLRQLNVLSTLPSDIHSGLEMVLLHRLDGYVLAEFVADAQLKQHPKGKLIKKLQPPFYQQPLFLVFSPKLAQSQPQLVQSVWQQIPRARYLLSGAGAGIISTQAQTQSQRPPAELGSACRQQLL